jgi:hypothetical protein
MFETNDALSSALTRAQNQLGDAERHVALANAGHQSRSADAAMAQTARAAIFSEALLSAMHARLAELKSASKS